MQPDFPLQQLESVYQKALAFHSEGRLEQAIAGYREVLERIPQADMVLYNLGVALYEAEECTAAKKAFEQALAISDKDPDYWFNLALCCKKLNLLKETLAAYRNALQCKPDDIEILYSFGCYCKDCGASQEAMTLYRHILELDPTYVPALNNLAYLYHIQDDHEQAIRLYQALLTLVPQHSGAQHMLAALQGETAAVPAKEYIKNLFDNYSEDFDSSLLDGLAYQVPQLLRDLVNREGGKAHYLHTLDLGCGTGLCGRVFREITRQLDGIDLSPKMLAKAAEKNVYDELYEAELVSFLISTTDTYDLLLAADIFTYFGDLDKVFSALQQASDPHAHLIFSVEKAGQIPADRGWQLGVSGRYSHDHEYIVHTAASYGFILNHSVSAELRKEKGKAVEGLLYFFELAA